MNSQNPALSDTPHGDAFLQSALYEWVVENSPDLISIVNRDYVYRMVNGTYVARYGKQREEIIGRHAKEILGDEAFENIIKPNLDRCFSGSTVNYADWFVYPKFGRRYMDVYYYPLPTNGGSIKFVAAVIHDITDHKNAEEALGESESRYRLLAENIKDVIWTMDPNTMRFTYISPSVALLRGYTAEEAMSLRLDETLTPSAYKKAAEILARELSPENVEKGDFPESYTLELEEIRKDGTTVCSEETATILFDDHGNPTEILGVTRDITDRKKAEESLRRSEQRYRNLIEAANDIVAVTDAKTGRFISMNSFGLQTLGYTEEELLAMSSYLELVHPDDRSPIVSALTRFLADGTRHPNFPIKARTADGTYIDVEQNSSIITDSHGNPIEILTIARDVTERKRMENALKESEEKCRVALEAAHDPIFMVNEGGDFLSVNYEAARAMNSSPEKMVGRNMREFFPEAIASRQMHTIGLFFQGKETIHQFEQPTITAQGKRWYNTKLSPIRNPKGEVWAVMGIARDITEHRRMDEKLKLTMERYHRILDSSHDMIFVVDADAKILFANKSWHESVPYSFEEIQDLDIFETVHPADRNKVRECFQQAVLGCSARNVEYRVLTREQELRWFETNVDPIDWPEAERTVVMTAREITQRKRAEEALERSLSLLSATLDATAEGIVAINEDGEITNFNGKFVEIFQIPGHLLASGKSQAAARHIADQIKNPEEFFEKVRDSYIRSDEEISDTLEFKNGRIVERFIRPQKIGNEIAGGVLSFRDITGRKQAEEDLKRSEEKYRSIFWEAPDIFYTLDLKTWIIRDANKYALEALEYSPEDLRNMEFSKIIHHDDLERATSVLGAMAAQEDRIPHFPLRMLARTGRVLHIEQSGVIFKDDEGNAKTFLGLAHDVTYRIERDEMIEKRNERISVLYELVKTFNETLDLENLIKHMLKVVPQVTRSESMAIFLLNEETQRFEYLAHYGLSDEAVEATNHLATDEGIHGYLAEHRKPLLTHDLKEHPLLSRSAYVSTMDIEGAIVVPLILDEEMIGSLWVARTLGNPYDEEHLELVSAMANHIAIAIANARLYSQLREREARLQSILETSRDGIAVISSDRHATYVNSAILDMFGYNQSDDLFSMNTESFFNSESRGILEDIRKRLSSGEEIRETIRFKGKRKDGSTLDAEARLGNFFEKGKRYGVAIIRDVTEQNRMRFQLEQSGKLAAIGELAAGVAHEINNPIATLDMQTGLMRDILRDERDKLRGPFFRDIDEYLDIVENQVRRCQSVTNDLLSFSRSPIIRTETCDINDLVKRTIKLVSSLTDKDPKIGLRLNKRLPGFFGDSNRLEQIFVNLLNNALKAIKPGGTITVTTRTDSNKNICVEFSDTGPGIDPETESRIFDPFFTTDPAGGGTGLGLSVSHYLVKEMNGSIDVRSSAGKGATFTVTLPNPEKTERSIGND